MKNIFMIIFAAAAIVFASLYYFQSDKVALYKDVINELELSADRIPAFESAVARLKADKIHYEQENEQLKQQIEDRENTIAAMKVKNIPETSETENEQVDKDKKDPNEFMSGLAKMLDDPDMRDAIRSQIKNTQVNPIYGTLISKLNLSPDKAEAFTDLIADRFLTGTDSIKMLSGGNDKDSFKKAMDDIKNQKDEIDSQIKELLGDEAYSEYEEYSNSEGERMALSQYNQQLSFSGVPVLSPEQNDDLVNIMREEAEASKKNPNYINLEDANPMDLNEDNISDIIFQQIDINKKVKDRTRNMLSADQQKKFEEYQESYIKQMETGLRLSVQMFGKKNKKE